MVKEHEYSVLGGLNRARIGQTIGAVAAVVSSVIVSLFLILVGLVEALGWGENIPPLILWPIGASAIYAALYWAFDRHGWKWWFVPNILCVPNLSGTWRCQGESIQPNGTPGAVWEGEATIVQSWDRIRVHLETPQSHSDSIAAALVCDEASGFRLLYNYKNFPKINQTELVGHRGSAELVFNKDLRSAKGEYFNGHGRYTFGTMQLTRKI